MKPRPTTNATNDYNRNTAPNGNDDVVSSLRKINKATAPCSTEIEEGETYTYIGRAEPGSETSKAVWSIQRITNATGSSRYADGGRFTQIFDNRAFLTYA